MSEPHPTPVLSGLRPAGRGSVWAAPLISWAALLALLAGSVLATHLPLPAALRAAVNLGVGGVSALAIVVVFMRLDRASNLVRLAAAAGVVWLSFLFLLAGADYLTRP